MTAQHYTVSIGNTGTTIACAAGETILAAAIRAGVDYPYGCASGNCGACISQLDAGQVALLPRNDGALSVAQMEAGQTLACRARPRTDVAITWLGRGRR